MAGDAPGSDKSLYFSFASAGGLILVFWFLVGYSQRQKLRPGQLVVYWIFCTSAAMLATGPLVGYFLDGKAASWTIFGVFILCVGFWVVPWSRLRAPNQ
jgi:hypothetical protein